MKEKINKFAVILAGCGRMDGSEVHESTLTLWAIHKNGADYQCFAPDSRQHHVINHLNDKEMAEERNMLIEAARIARGNVLPLSRYRQENFSGLIFPGGFGAAKNLFSYALDGVDCSVNEEVSRAITTTHAAEKPIGALCIAPVLIARVIADAKVTIGNNAGTAADIEAMGAKHIITGHGETAVDEKNKIVTTPCYMLESRVDQVGEGIDRLVMEMLRLVD